MKKRSAIKNGVRRLLLAVLGLVLGANVYLANARNVVGNQLPMPFGVGAAVVLSGSMEPALSKGDLLFVRKTDAVQPGNIVVYQAGSSLIVHRVVALENGTVITQGDANNTPDEPVSPEQIKGVVWFRLAGAGAVLGGLKTPVGMAAVLALAFVLAELSFQKEKQQEEQQLAAIKEEIRRLKDEQKAEPKKEP